MSFLPSKEGVAYVGAPMLSKRSFRMRIAKELIDDDALQVVTRLSAQGFQAYLVGGCVRDLLLRRTPKDFDIATNATPGQIKSLFRNSRIIGRRFRLVHIFFGHKIIETSTFRANPRQDDELDENKELLIRRDNVFGSATEDALRRDFTINGLFYDAKQESVIDHVDGLRDLRAGLVRTIGEPDIRFREDPVRMMRAIKFAARLGFEMEPKTYQALVRQGHKISKCSAPRVLEEIYRLLKGRASRRSMELLIQTGIAKALSPHLASILGGGMEIPVFSSSPNIQESKTDTWATETPQEKETVEDPSLSYLDTNSLPQRREQSWDMLDQLDAFAIRGHKISNSLALSALLAPFILPELADQDIPPKETEPFFWELFDPISKDLKLVRRDTERARQLLLVQKRLTPNPKRRMKPSVLIQREYFKDALTLFEMVRASKGESTEVLDYWKKHLKHLGPKNSPPSEKRRKRRRGGRRRRQHS